MAGIRSNTALLIRVSDALAFFFEVLSISTSWWKTNGAEMAIRVRKKDMFVLLVACILRLFLSLFLTLNGLGLVLWRHSPDYHWLPLTISLSSNLMLFGIRIGNAAFRFFICICSFFSLTLSSARISWLWRTGALGSVEAFNVIGAYSPPILSRAFNPADHFAGIPNCLAVAPSCYTFSFASK